MKILHLMLGNFYIDNYSYQENMLPKFHIKAGYEVEIVASLFTFDSNGKGTYLEEPSKYVNENGIPVTRLAYSRGMMSKTLRKYKGLEAELNRISPDIIFIHGVQFWDISIVARYLKNHKGISVYADNHADFSNSATNFLSKTIKHEIFWRHCAHVIEPYVKKFYGVLPARVDFLVNEYKLPKEKVELLVMGADDELVEKSSQQDVRDRVRKKYKLNKDDFVIMTGGKIDAFKTQTLLLMEAVKRIQNPKVRLIVFGSVTPELKPKVEELADGNKIQYIGWIKANDSYDLFAAADLVVFPGRHSVFWEQVAAQGIPMICKKWNGTTHVDVGGNLIFLEEDSTDEIYDAIMTTLDSDKYQRMKSIAEEKGKSAFLYSKIAERSIS